MENDKQSVNTVRIGVVGLGIGRQHVRAYQQMENVEVIAIADIDLERLHTIGAEYGIANRYETYDAMLARDDIDAISVCTPNHLHGPHTIAALESGRHVLVEKPIAASLADGQQMVATAQRVNRVLQVVFNHRERGDVQTLKRIINQGKLGRIYHAKAWWLRRSGIPGMGSWFTQKALSGGGPLIDLGVHMLDMVLFLMDNPEPISVNAAVYSELGSAGRGGNPSAGKKYIHESFEVEDLATAFVRLKGEATLFLETSWATYRANGDEFGVTLFGTEGGAEIKVVNYVQDDTLTIYTDFEGVPGDVKVHTGKGAGHNTVIRTFVDRVRGGDWQAYHGALGLSRMRIIDACYRSAKQHREIKM